MTGWNLATALVLALALWAVRDATQRRNPVLRNFPIIGHFRFWLAELGPKLRQYIIASNNEERPFSRDERSWISRSSRRVNNYFGFGTDNDLEHSPNYIIIRHAAFPLELLHEGAPGFDPAYPIPSAKVMGEHRDRRHAFRPRSVMNISAMSFGSLSAPAVEALNRGAQLAGCLHNTGEGGIAPYHDYGGDLVWQIGTGYFGCRNANGTFSRERFLEQVDRFPVKAIEIKLSQGAKPGMGGILPGVKVTEEIADIRHVPQGVDCISPSSHSAFSDVDSMLDFAEEIADASGLPVGIKSAVGEERFWQDLARHMARDSRGVDFITIDGGEGGTGAGPLTFTDHVALPFWLAMSTVYGIFTDAGVADRVVWIGAGRLGFPARAALAMGLGCDMINLARESMLSIGCIQAQLCHTGRCPTGVTAQRHRYTRGLDPEVQSKHFANYVVTLRQELLELCRACGVAHPDALTLDHFDILDDRLGRRSARDVLGGYTGTLQ